MQVDNGSGESQGANREKILERMQVLASGSAVVVFTVRGCCMGHVVKRLLFGLGVGPTIVELDHLDYDKDGSSDGREIRDLLFQLVGKLGQHHCQPVPVVFIGGKLLGGVETLIASHINGTLVPLLKNAGALWL